MNYEDARTIVKLFERLIFSAEPEMRHRINHCPKDFLIASPLIITEVFKIALSICYAPAPAEINSEGNFLYKGIQVIPGYEMALVIYHRYYSRYNEGWMIHKIPFGMNGTVLGLEGAVETIKRLYSIPGTNP